MSKSEILKALDNCIEVAKVSENLYIQNQLNMVVKELTKKVVSL